MGLLQDCIFEKINAFLGFNKGLRVKKVYACNSPYYETHKIVLKGSLLKVHLFVINKLSPSQRGFTFLLDKKSKQKNQLPIEKYLKAFFKKLNAL